VQQLSSVIINNNISTAQQHKVISTGTLLAGKSAIVLNYKCGPIPNAMAALPNIGGALCPTPQFG